MGKRWWIVQMPRDHSFAHRLKGIKVNSLIKIKKKKFANRLEKPLHTNKEWWVRTVDPNPN